MSESERKQVWAAIRRLSVQEKLGIAIRLHNYYHSSGVQQPPEPSCAVFSESSQAVARG